MAIFWEQVIEADTDPGIGVNIGLSMVNQRGCLVGVISTRGNIGQLGFEPSPVQVGCHHLFLHGRVNGLNEFDSRVSAALRLPVTAINKIIIAIV